MKRLPLSDRFVFKFPNYRPGFHKEDPSGVQRAKVPFESLKELWIMTGTNCNLACTGCYTESFPGNHLLQHPTLEDIVPYLHEAVSLGAKKLNYTGGEPFLNPKINEIIIHSLEYLPTLVLTNGTRVARYQIENLIDNVKDKPNQLSFRISLDSPYEKEHDKIRDPDNLQKESVYQQALETIKFLRESEIRVSIAGRIPDGQEETLIKSAYEMSLLRQGIPDISLVLFP